MVYVIVLLGFFALKLFVNVPYENAHGVKGALRIGSLLFDVLILGFTVVGTWEMLRAFGEKLHVAQKVVVMTFAIAIVLAYAVSDFVFADIFGVRLPEPGLGEISTVVGRNYSMHITFGVFATGVAVLLAFMVFRYSSVTLESTGDALLCYIYPSFFLVVLSVCNHLEIYSELALMLVFIVSPCADTLAFVFGKSMGKKLPAKMAPTISPNKTLIGGFGGLIGGALGAVIVFFAYYGIMRLDDVGLAVQVIRDISANPLNLLFFIALGVLTSAFSQFGDLVESAIKRKLGLKDMGKIMPGHGGILDRIDSALYAGLIVAICLVFRIMIVG